MVSHGLQEKVQIVSYGAESHLRFGPHLTFLSITYLLPS